MGIVSTHRVVCDFCGVEPEAGQSFDTFEEAYAEMQRLTRHESWLLRDRGSTNKTLLCPECVTAGR